MKVPTGGKGGMILLSTDINATAGDVIANRITAKLRTYWQRLFKDSLVDGVVLKRLKESGVGVGWSIGPTFKGRYYDPDKQILYPERSFYVEILDAPYPLLKAIAEDLLGVFNQEVVILKCYDTGEAERIRMAAASSGNDT